MPASAITQPIGQGLPLAKAPTSAEPRIPEPYWQAPTSIESAPARFGGLGKRAHDRVGDDEPTGGNKHEKRRINPARPPQPSTPPQARQALR
jgi:hypothetical protein